MAKTPKARRRPARANARVLLPGVALSPYPTVAIKTWVAGYGPLTAHEAERAACAVWDGLHSDVKARLRDRGVEGHLCTTRGVAGLIELRDALASLIAR
jgi:hypothetical protein